MEKQNKFYWLKLKRDFFKRHDIRIIESMQNGKDYILFYLKLLCESLDHNGNLRFSEQIPYNEDMLATITNTNIDVVRSAIKVFTQLNMMEMLDDGTFFMNEVNKMMGSAIDNDNANRQRRFRERKKQDLLQERYDSVTKNNESIEIELEIEKDKKENILKEKDLGFLPEIEEKSSKNEKYQEILDYWNSKEIIKHRQLTNEIIKAIQKALKDKTETDICNAIDRYSYILKDESYFFEYKWTLVEFLTRKNGYKDFLDDGCKWMNYVKSDSGKKAINKIVGSNLDIKEFLNN